MKKYADITHVIFDMDGLLLDTEPFYTEAARAIAGRYGKTFDWTLKSRMIGLRSIDSAKLFLEHFQIPLTVGEYLAVRRTILEELFPHAEPLPGALELTRHFHRRAVHQAIASSSDTHYFKLKTSRHRHWFSIFECVVLGDDPEVKHGKPAPDIFEVVARRLQCEPARCLVLEDSPAGVEAARLAGMFAVAVPDPNMDPARYADAHQVLRTLEDFNPECWGLPAFEPPSGRGSSHNPNAGESG
jgi:pseudouridine-5'-monophosphatase